MSEPFQRTLFPGTAVICGRALPPLTFWRLQCLQAISSPFLGASAETEVTLADLLLALRAVNTVNLVPPVLRPTLKDRWLYRRRKRNRAWFEHQAALFLQWLSLHQLRPELWQSEDNEGRAITAPLILSQIAGLMDAGMTHAEAWDTAPGYAAWLLTARAERDSDRVKFATEEDEEINRMCDELALRDESEIIAQAKLDLPPETFEAWLSARTALPVSPSPRPPV